MLKKPVIFLTSRNYLLHYRLSILHLAEELGMKTVDISVHDKWRLNYEVNELLYEKYFNNYISCNKNQKNKTSYEIIYENLIKLFHN